MSAKYHARWVSKPQSEQLRRSNAMTRAMLLDTINGFILVEPPGKPLAEGEILSPEAADYELRMVWMLSPKSKLSEARRRLGLAPEPQASALSDV